MNSKISLSGLDGPGLPQSNRWQPKPAAVVGASQGGLLRASQGGGEQTNESGTQLMVGLDLNTLVNNVRENYIAAEIPQLLCHLSVEPIEFLTTAQLRDRLVILVTDEHSEKEIRKSFDHLVAETIPRPKQIISELLRRDARSLAQCKARPEMAQPRLAPLAEETPRKELLTDAHMALLGPGWQKRPVNRDHTRVELGWQLLPAVLPGGIGSVAKQLVLSEAGNTGALLKFRETYIDAK